MGALGRREAVLETRERKRPDRADPVPSRPDVVALLALQRSAGNAAATALLARTAATARLIQREPDEEKVKQRAHEIWMRKGSPVQTPEQEQTDYFDAQRQIRIEERAYSNWAAKPGGGKAQSEQEQKDDYFEAEEQLAAEAADALPSVEQAEKEAEIPKDPGAVEVPEPVEEKESKEEEKEEKPAPVAPAKYIPPRPTGVAPIIRAAPVAAPLPPGSLADAQLGNLGFWKRQGRWQKDLQRWYGFDVHISVNPMNNAFDEFHVKFDLPKTAHRIFYFFDVTGTANWSKCTKPGAAKAALRADGATPAQLEDALKEMDQCATGEARALASTLH